MPINKKDSPAKIMHELKTTRKSTKNPSRKSAQKHGTEREQDIAIMLNTKGKSNKDMKNAKSNVKSPARNVRKAAK